MALETIQGQPRAVELLRRALAAERLAHAYAFVGPPGSGRTTTGLAFAQAVLCPQGGCGRCRACALAAARQHPDLHLIVATPPETNPKGARAIRIGAIRELERRAALKPAMAARKVFIVDDAERMTGEAPEAFLKTLEEPPDRTIIVLVLDRARAVPATVLSRCQLVRFRARADEGAAADRAETEEMLAEVRARGMDALFRRSQVFDRDRPRAERIVDACWLYGRDLVLAKCGAAARLLGVPASAQALAREAERWTLDELLEAVETCRQARRALGVNVTPRLTLEVVLSRLALRAA
jgi:DNA polymerase-3 subunit delta'